MPAALHNRIALVTGSTSGIGRAIALRLADNGARVVVTGRRSDWGARVEQEIRERGGDARFCAADVSVGDEVAALVAFTLQTYGGLDILVNNAGMIPRRSDGTSLDGALHQTEESYWDDIYRISLKSVFWTGKHAIPHLLQSQHAAIVHIASNVAEQGYGVDVYTAIKGALVSLTRSMAVSYAHQIRVNCVNPGTIIVERNRPLWDAHPEMYDQWNGMGLTRVGVPDDIAEAVVYLAGAEFVSGSILTVDGGMSIRALPIPTPK